MKLVIDIEDYDRKYIVNDGYHIPDTINWKIAKAIIDGTPLPKGHGRLIDADWVKSTLDLYTFNFNGTYGQFIRQGDIDMVPTIIEGSEIE